MLGRNLVINREILSFQHVFTMFSSEQDHCSGGKRKHSGELHCSRNNQDQVCRGDPLSFNGFIIFELWTEMEDNLIFSKALTDNEDIADKALENLPLGR